jgi:Spy/CpxP family protein refolding chaperone
MKGWALAVAGALAAAGLCAYAPPAAADANGDKLRKRVERMKQGLDLTDEQVAKIEAILSEAAKQRESLRADGTRSARHDAREAVRAKIDEVLTDEQRGKRDEMIAKRGKRRGRDGRRGRGDGAQVSPGPIHFGN